MIKLRGEETLAKINKLQNILFILTGVFCTLGALMFKVGGTQLAIVNLFIFAAIALQLVTPKIHFQKYKIPFIVLIISFSISTVVSNLTLGGSWAPESLRFTLKIALFLLPLVLLFSDEELKEKSKCFFYGLKISCYIQLFWELAQILLWNVFSISLNQVVFGDLLKITVTHQWTFISDGYFRPTGVSWEPANLSLALVVGFILTKNKILKVLFSLGVILSTSRTGIIIYLLAVGIYSVRYLYNFKKENRKIEIKFRKKEIIISAVAFIALVAAIVIFRDSIVNKFDMMLNSVARTFQKLNVVNSDDSSANMHMRYYLEIPALISKSTVVNFLFGYGTSCAGYPYTHFFGIYDYIPNWNPESDFITTLFGNGILGFGAYYYFMGMNLKLNKDNFKGILLIIVLLFAGIFYLYIRSTWPLIILIMLYINKDSKDSKFELGD
ncbi:O-antigen ligase family protein [Clostridium sp. YIM B02505]|uniref:O-antigen ligase family protein n=1 Tax=Clostridium yunnanense TaxID=2800325 RepID=A0ABS1EX61_9CLOT|nr:O-antigen ligase family protein [Clostridium yunnanense]MBK1813888.1 O-antigen ligase family protein [Clostridium yunnanense]